MVGLRRLSHFESLEAISQTMKDFRNVKWKFLLTRVSERSSFRRLNSSAQEYLEDSHFYDLDLLCENSDVLGRRVTISQADTVKEGKVKRGC